MNNNLFFRKPTINDYNLIKSIWEDPETMKPVGGIQTLSNKRYIKWFNYMMIDNVDKNCYYLIFSNNICVGEVSFHNFDTTQKEANLNIKVIANYRGKGIGRISINFILSHFFNEWNGEIINDIVDKDNLIGYKSLIAFGFRERINIDKNHHLYLTKDDFKLIQGKVCS